jgi:hypothetical protein
LCGLSSRKFRNSKKNVLKIVLIIVNINKDENKSLISNQFSLTNDFPPISWRTILREMLCSVAGTTTLDRE